MSEKSIVCFGEVLWDLLPTGKIAGGAPMNVAYHANNFGLKPKMISRVGADDLGRELLAFLAGKNIPTDLIQTDHTFPTGIVKVTLDEKGSPSYEIVQPAAWDYIHPTEEALDAVEKAAALVFGSLACRTDRTKKTLLQLVEAASIRVFDVNLRPPFFSKELLDELLAKASIVKMNDDELDTIAGRHGAPGDEVAKMDFLKKHYALNALIVTRGPNGAALLNDAGFFAHSGFPVKVRDTIGSGDAFLGAFLSKTLTRRPPEECLEFACAAGAFVATKQGATPAIGENDIKELIQNSPLS
jgi:fructokinase